MDKVQRKQASEVASPKYPNLSISMNIRTLSLACQHLLP